MKTEDEKMKRREGKKSGMCASEKAEARVCAGAPDLVEAALRQVVSETRPEPTFIERLSRQLRTRHLATASGHAAPRRAMLPAWGWVGAGMALLALFFLIGRALRPGVEVPDPAHVTGVAQAPTPGEPDFVAVLPPVLTDITPRPGAEVSADEAAITLRFSRPMDQPSVEGALHLTPAVDGDFSWDDAQTVTFRPKALASATLYRVALDATALGANGLALGRELAFSFSTLAPLTVTHVAPSAGDRGLRSDTPLLISFNYPLAPLNCAGWVADGAEGCFALPLIIEPEVVGEGMWLNTGVYRFDPQLGWNAGTTVTVTIPAGVRSVSGAVLDAPAVWSFSVAAPRALSQEPSGGRTGISPETSIRVRFNTPMDPAATVSAFVLRDSSGRALSGVFAWEDNGAQLIFTPTQRLELATQYTARIGEAARALGGAPIVEAREWRFTTAPLPAILSIQTYDNRQELRLYDSLDVRYEGELDPAEIEAHLRLTRAGVEIPFNVWVDAERRTAYVHWEKTPSTEYCLAVLPGLADRYGNPIPAVAPACFTTVPQQPAFFPATSERVLTLDAAEAARLYFVAVNVSQAELQLFTQGERNFMAAETGAGGERLRSWTLPLENPADQTVIKAVPLTESGRLPTGFYLLRWNYPGRGDYYWDNSLRFAVVDRHVTFKLGETEALAWVTDLRTGAPVVGAEVRLLSSHRPLEGRAVTDADGIARFTLPAHEAYWDSVMAVTGTPGEPGFGVANSRWQADAAPWHFDVDTRYYGSPTRARIYVHTDRPIYRPGQTIHLAGVLRTEEDARFALPKADTSVALKLYDPIYQLVAQQTVSVSAEGSFTADFDLAQGARLGGYRLEASLPGSRSDEVWSLDLTVAAYRKPEFEVRVMPELDGILMGETLRVLVEGGYYSGGPVSHARVHWTVRAAPAVFAPDVAGWWQWAAQSLRWDWQQDSEWVAEGDAVTDAQGRFLLELPAILKPFSGEEAVGAQTWTVEATLTDESGFAVTGRGQTTVHAGRFYLGLKPRAWVAPAGQEALVDVLALDWEATPVAGQEVSLTLARRSWRQVRSSQPFSAPTWAFEDTDVGAAMVSTDALGRAVARLTPPTSGSYVVKAESWDSEGNAIRSETWLWVSGPQAAAWQMAEGRVTPVADARSYRPGDTARILLPMPFAGPFEVLLTVERAGILEARRLTIREANPVIEVPILEGYAPNVVVSFVAVKGATASSGPDVRIGMVGLEVEPVQQLLTVEVLPDRARYGPREQVILTVRTRDANGKPVDAEVTLAVVDKAVLALADPNAPSLRDAFYGKRPLRVLTGDSSLVLFNRVARDLARLAEDAERLIRERDMGGIGGGGGGEAAYVADVRDVFPDTAHWETHLRTGPTGETQVIFDLPDSLTTWVVDVRAVTAATQVGQAVAEFIVTRPLLVRPATPRFLVAGDRVELAAVIHNNTDTALDVSAQLEALGVGISDSASQQVNIPAQGRVQVRWQVQAPRYGAEWALFTFSAEGGGYRDAARPTVGRESDRALPIYRYQTPDVMGTSGVLWDAGSRLEAIILPAEVGPESALTVRLSPSLAAGMTEALTYLEHFEHECTEQLVSRFLPNVMTYRALRALELEDAALRANLEHVLAEALDKLYARQQGDGGWGWFHTRSDLQVSAYAALGLLQAERSGFPVRERALSRALGYLELALPRSVESEVATLPQALALYVLAEGGRELPGTTVATLFTTRTRLDVTGRAYLALALGIADPADARVRTLLEELRADAELSAAGARWEVAAPRYWATTPRATAVALLAFARLAPEDPLVPQAARWLMVNRQADRWGTTQENAWAIIALTEVMLATGELRGDYIWGAAFNGRVLGEGQVAPETVRATTVFTVPAASMLREWPNALEISRGAGEGVLYYTADLTLYRPAEEVQAESRGMVVQRRYCAVSGPAQVGAGRDAIPECAPITSAQSGDLVEVRLTLIVPQLRAYVVLEDWYPAGMEPVDSTLKTEVEGLAPESRLLGRNVWWWQGGFEHQELRDARAVFYASQLSAGTYELRYYLRAVTPGEYRVLPATASEMYFPEVWGRTEGTIFRVER